MLEGTAQPEPDSPASLFTGTRTSLDLWEAIRTGFYPPIHDRRIPPEVWLPDYIRTYIERDVRSLTNIGDLCPKLYFHDTDSLCWLLGIRASAQIAVHPLRGAIFENYVVGEIAKAYLHHRRPAPLFFWRDRTGHEVDLLIEEAGALFPVEIKSAQTLSADLLEGLLWWSKLAGVAAGRATLVYAGREAFTRNEVAIRPWFAV